MTTHSASDDVNAACSRVREFSKLYLSGQIPESFEAVRNLLQFLLQITVLAPSEILRLTSVKYRATERVLGVEGQPLRLNNDRYLRVSSILRMDETPAGRKLRAYETTYQYQLDQGRHRWIFRYEYLRRPDDPHPGAHLHVRATPIEDCQIAKPFERLHFPTGRPTIEWVIRLLIDQFQLTPNTDNAFWRPVLTASENFFLDHHHRPSSGPSA
jgi:hypothetical protein